MEFSPESTFVYAPCTSGMATFPEITSINFSVRKGLHSIIQEPVSIPFHEFQFTSQFDFYRPCKSDLIYLCPPSNDYVALHNELAISIWESLKMKTKYILAAAHRWNGDIATSPLPTYLSDAKLDEIHMIRPALPFLHPLTFNPLLCPGPPATVLSRVAIWQERSRMLSAWICKARLNSQSVSGCSWRWPVAPIPSRDLDDDSSSMEISSTTTECDSLFHEEPVTPSRAIRACNTQASLLTPKRPRDSSPLDTQRDGDEANKRQLVLWRPTISQLLEQQHALLTGEVSSGSSISNHSRAQDSVPASSAIISSSSNLDSHSCTLDPRPRRFHSAYAPAAPLMHHNLSLHDQSSRPSRD